LSQLLNMSSDVKKYLPILRLLAKSTPYKRKKLLLAADTNFIKILIECCFNILNGNVKLPKQKIQKLEKYKEIIRKIAKASKNINNKKKVLIQKGGAFLPLILPSIISGLVTLLK
jgi:hypothetical protein